MTYAISCEYANTGGTIRRDTMYAVVEYSLEMAQERGFAYCVRNEETRQIVSEHHANCTARKSAQKWNDLEYMHSPQAAVDQAVWEVIQDAMDKEDTTAFDVFNALTDAGVSFTINRPA